MPELLRIQTADFELSIWCNDISSRQATYQSTLAKRQNNPVNDTVQDPKPIVRFSPPLSISEASFVGTPIALDNTTHPTGLVAEIKLNKVIFFENLQYQFEWIFYNQTQPNKVIAARVTHRSRSINDSFRFSQAQRSMPARLTGVINTANDVGWLRLPLEYQTCTHTHSSNIAFEVLPTKMSLHDDLPAMYQAIDSVFPLWRFSLVEKTEQDAAQSQQRNHFPLLWLANFSHLRLQLEHALKVINQAPHSRLQAHISYNKAAQLKGKLSAHLGAKIKEDFANGLHQQHYSINKKRLSVDTPENQFIKMVVSTTKKRLANFEHKLRQNNAAPDKQRLSVSFLDELHQWQQPLQRILKQGFMTEVSDYNGRNSESLVLQQKVGYSSVYRIWQQLKYYLEVFDSQSSISMKSVAEIYEVWCFLTLKDILVDELGFTEVAAKKQILKLNDYFEYQLKDGFVGAFEFVRGDGVTAKLAHEPHFKKNSQGVRTYSVSQKPDILLEVTLPNKQRFIWLFDAKYRIKTVKGHYDEPDEDIDTIDFVPNDALNQMHRYRDALIRVTKSNTDKDQNTLSEQKSRPVFGGFALYPGSFDQVNSDNPYFSAIDEISIGAFALLPDALSSESSNDLQSNSKNSNGHYWLLEFLRQQLGTYPRTKQIADNTPVTTQSNISAVNSPTLAYQSNSKTLQAQKPHNIAEHIYLQDAARIASTGMQQVLYPDLTLTMAVAPKSGRQQDYVDNFKQGIAQWYHLPQKTFLDKYKQHIIDEIGYLALAITDEQITNTKQINRIWPIKNITLIARSAITEIQAGKRSDSNKLYYLFELDKPLSLRDSINKVPFRTFKDAMKLTTLAHLQQADEFDDITQVYENALA